MSKFLERITPSSSTKCLWSGAMLYACTWSLWMDYHGKEDAIANLEEHWISSSITVPLAIAGFLFFTFVYFKEKRSEQVLSIIMRSLSGRERS